MGLLMLATLLAYAVPSHAGLVSHRHITVSEQSVPAASPDRSVFAAPERGQDPCEDAGLFGGDACCTATQCTAMQIGLPSTSTAFALRPSASLGPIALATPEGIGTDPALRPPCLIL
ncbi:MAG TPA: hypothetical protein VD978_00930 [Azospirillum sp.]|nr:hypothetical protein [Azospirillum sp.]